MKILDALTKIELFKSRYLEDFFYKNILKQDRQSILTKKISEKNVK